MVSSCFPSRIKFGSFPFRLRRRGGAPKWLSPPFCSPKTCRAKKNKGRCFGEKSRKASAVRTGPRPLCLGSAPPGAVPPEEGILPQQTTPRSLSGTSENICSHFPHVRQISAGSLHGPVSATLPSVTLLRSSTSCVGADIRPSQRVGWIPSLWGRCVRGPGLPAEIPDAAHSGGHKAVTKFDEGNGADSADAVITFRGARDHSQLWEERSKNPISARPAAGRSVVRDKSQCYKKGLWKLSNKRPGGQLPTRKIA